jgi:hypothetical protein
MVPRSLNRFQQLNAIKLSGTTPQLDEGRKVLENAATLEDDSRAQTFFGGRGDPLRKRILR